MRITLLKKDTVAGAGAELLVLCSTITEDGSVSDAEVDQLRQWLLVNQAIGLPAIAFLNETVNRIIADGRVTPEERRELHVVLERVLPKEVREIAQSRRRSIEAKEYIENFKNRRVHNFDFMVAGVHYDGRESRIRQYARVPDSVYLVRDANNKFSRNAIEVRLGNGVMIGFVPEENAIELAPLLDGGHRQIARLKKILTGGRAPIPVIVADIYAPDATVAGSTAATEISYTAVTHSDADKPSATSAAIGRGLIGCGSLLVLLFLIVRSC